MSKNHLNTLPKIKDPALKEAWLTALRSGEYKQTKGTLKDANGYCCLGVLCDILPEGEWDGGTYVVEAKPDDVFFGPYSLTSSSNLPEAAMGRHLTPHREFDFDGLEELMTRNDGSVSPTGRRRQTFKQIANIIERHM